MPLGAIVANLMNGFAEPAGITFWQVDPDGYTVNPAARTVNPAAYDPIEGPEDSPWD